MPQCCQRHSSSTWLLMRRPSRDPARCCCAYRPFRSAGPTSTPTGACTPHQAAVACSVTKSQAKSQQWERGLTRAAGCDRLCGAEHLLRHLSVLPSGTAERVSRVPRPRRESRISQEVSPSSLRCPRPRSYTLPADSPPRWAAWSSRWRSATRAWSSRAAVERGERVLVVGAGPIGLGSLMLARSAVPGDGVRRRA